MTSGTRRGWGVSLTPPAVLYPRETPGTHCTGGWVGPRAGLHSCEKSLPPPGFDPRIVQPVASRYTEWATRLFMYLYVNVFIYTGCPRRNVPDFGRVFVMLKYSDITQNTYVQSWTVTEIMAREKCDLLAGPRTVPVSWQVLSMFILEFGVRYGKSAHTSLQYVYTRMRSQPCYISACIHVPCIVLGTLRTTMTCVRVFLVIQFNDFLLLTS